MLTRRGLLRGLAQIAVLGPLALRRLPKVLEEEFKYNAIYIEPRYFYGLIRCQKEVLLSGSGGAWLKIGTDGIPLWADNGPARIAPTPGATS